MPNYRISAQLSGVGYGRIELPGFDTAFTVDLLPTLIGGPGAAGPGVPAGGTTGQVLAKTSGADYATGWVDQSGGGSSVWGGITGTLSAQTDLQAALDGKAATVHTHTSSQITDSTAAGRTLLTAADATAQRAALNVANGATANSPDATLLDRANHTGTQSAATITGLAAVATNGSATALTSGTLSASRLPAFTGDATSAAGSAALTLATVNSNVGAFGSATQIPTFTVNAKGLTTAAANVAIQIAESQVTGLVADLAAKAPLASPTFTGTVTLPAGQVVNGVTLTTAGGTSNFLRADGTYAAPPGGGGGGATSGTATINFGAAPGSQETTLAVTGQAGILAGSPIRVWIQGEASADHNAYEHSRILAGRVGLAVESVSAGVGFTIVAASELQLTGQVSVRWQWG